MATAALHVRDVSSYYSTRTDRFPDIGITLTNGPAPHAVFFEGWESSPRPILIDYQWDFGAGTENDEDGRYAQGMNAAHVYETPGTYTATLMVRDHWGDWSEYATTTITVTDRSAGTTYYVDRALGSDAYDGKSPTVGNGHGPWQTATKALGTLKKGNGVVLNPKDAILFNRGQTFDLDGNITYIDANTGSRLISMDHGQIYQGVQYGAYGTGARPIIQWVGTADTVPGSDPPVQAGAPLYYAATGGASITWSDLDFNFLNTENDVQVGGIVGAYSGWKHILWLRCGFRNANSSIWGFEGLDPAPETIFTVACEFTNYEKAWTGSGTFIYGGTSHLALINNSFDVSANHIAYLKAMNKGVITGNIFSRPAFGRTALRLDGGPASAQADPPGQNSVAVGMTANNVVIADNRFLGWVDPEIGGAGRGGGAHNGNGTRYNYCLVELGPNGDGQQIHDQIVFERNVITNFEVGMSVKNCWNTTLRNNLFVTPVAGRCLDLNNDPSFGTNQRYNYSPLLNVFIYGNTFLTGSRLIDPPAGASGNYAIVRMSAYVPGTTFWGVLDTNVQFRNNILATYSTGTARVALELKEPVAGFSSDWNLYYMPNVVGGTFMKRGATSYTIEGWREATGQDADSLSVIPGFAGAPLAELNTGVTGTPASQEACVAEADALIEQLQLTISSAAIQAGQSQGAALFYDFKKLPRSVPPSVGAFEAPQQGAPMSVRAMNALNAALNAENALMNGGTIAFTDADLGAGNVLATFTLSATAFATSTANSAAANGLPASVTPSASGTIAGWIAKTSGGATVLTGHASELTMSSKVVASGIAFTFTGWTRTAGVGS